LFGMIFWKWSIWSLPHKIKNEINGVNL
jgi:hypothetical protein